MKNKFLLVVLSMMLLVAVVGIVEARTFITYCVDSNNVKIPCYVTNYQTNETQYFSGAKPYPTFNLNDNLRYDLYYNYEGTGNYKDTWQSLFLDSNLGNIALGATNSYSNNGWTTSMEWLDNPTPNLDYWRTQLKWNNNDIAWLTVLENRTVYLVKFLYADASNAPPALPTLPNVSVQQGSGLNNDIIDLYIYAGDDHDTDAQLTFSIISQTNSNVANCVLDSDRYIDCTSGSSFGSSIVTVGVMDSGALTAVNSFVITLNAPSTTTCTSFTYSAWGACMPSNTQTRTVTSQSPTGCSGGSPVLTQACTYVPPVNDTTAPTIISRDVVTTNQSAVINLVLSEASNSTINYGLSPSSLTTSVSNSAFLTSPTLTLNGLTSNTTYYYNIVLCDISNNCATSGIFNFITNSTSSTSNNPPSDDDDDEDEDDDDSDDESETGLTISLTSKDSGNSTNVAGSGTIILLKDGLSLIEKLKRIGVWLLWLILILLIIIALVLIYRAVK